MMIIKNFNKTLFENEFITLYNIIGNLRYYINKNTKM